MEHLFKGKRADNGEWIQGYLFKSWDDCYICWGTDNGKISNILVIAETVGQYTGVDDKNGQKIFEGDIAVHNEYECFGKVVFSKDELAFAFLVIVESNNGTWTEFEWLYEYADGLRIIGNIHDNPELLEVE